MQEVGLSMAMGAFLAGILLAESNFRHQLEADIEPFRGMLLGLFFMSVGMSIDGGLVKAMWPALFGATAAAILVKVGLVAGLFRLFGSSWLDAVRGAAILAPAGEFAFVLLPVAAGLGLLDANATRFAVALAALTMLVGPVAAKALEAGLARRRSTELEQATDVIESTEARVLVIGFGRFGQILTQVLLAEGVGVTVIDKDVEQIRSASRFGFRVYYGDGTRLDVLRAAGIGRVELVCICIDEAESALKIVDMVHEEFESVRTYVRAYDRNHAVELMNRDVDYQLRETVESALAFGRATLAGLGVPDEVATRTAEDVRKRDVARLVLQQAGALPDGSSWMRGAQGEIKPEPLTAPQRPARALSAETRDIIGSERRDSAQRALETQDADSRDVKSRDSRSRDLETQDGAPDA
jgi:CPA2 family monovalent cation:H+ antiporter-2/glutathione-regulated potassium-efflux system protein KefB